VNRPRLLSWDYLVKSSVRLLIAAVWLMIAAVGVYLGNTSYQAFREQHVRRVYDAQKRVVYAATQEFVAELTGEGFHVINESTGQGGSGEWREIVAVAAEKTPGELEVCYVEVQGFVSHNSADRPIWTKNLPMSISRRGRGLDARYIEKLAAMLEKRHWEFEVNNRCKEKSPF
jgi:hypothetical protein